MSENPNAEIIERTAAGLRILAELRVKEPDALLVLKSVKDEYYHICGIRCFVTAPYMLVMDGLGVPILPMWHESFDNMGKYISKFRHAYLRYKP